ncbi:MAG: DUF411 domain-containing protein [Gemmatimonadota bacterium]|nr:DUF411 domain-containing protein [Gemmatimonadota bacterium]
MTVNLSRREWLVASLSGALLAVSGRAADAAALTLPDAPLTVYKDPACRCCDGWVIHLRAAGFQPTVRDDRDMSSVKRRLGVPVAVQSCHTAILDEYLIEGHVPASDMRRLLRDRPAVRGLAVPGMPSGSPGMESSPPVSYAVISFQANGRTAPYATHRQSTTG